MCCFQIVDGLISLFTGINEIVIHVVLLVISFLFSELLKVGLECNYPSAKSQLNINLTYPTTLPFNIASHFRISVDRFCEYVYLALISMSFLYKFLKQLHSNS